MVTKVRVRDNEDDISGNTRDTIVVFIPIIRYLLKT